MLVANAIAPGLRGGATYDSTVLADSPVAFWELNESTGTSAADATGNGHTGTYTGGFTLNQTGIGDGEGAVLLNGSSGYVTAPDSAALEITGDCTLEAWVHPTDLSNYWFVITKCLSNGATTNPYEFRLDSGTGVADLLMCASGTGKTFAATNGVASGAWSHIAVTRQAFSTETIIHYLNGSANGSSSGIITAGPYADSGRPVYIGTRDDNFSFFKGLIAKVAIYNYALTATQISNHYNARGSGAIPGLSPIVAPQALARSLV